jgi:iron complex outermembrane receptor protein
VIGAVDWYTRSTTDLIIEFGVPVPPNLFDRTYLNVGNIKNTGLEFALSWNAVNKANFTYTPTFTMSWYLKNEITSLSDPDRGLEYGVRDIANLGVPGQGGTPLIRIEEEKPYGQIWGLMFDEINTDGNWVFKDANGDGIASGGNEDRAVIGSGIPDFEFGWNNTFAFRKFDLNIFFRGAIGHDLVNTYRAFYEVPNAIGSYNVMKTSTNIRNEETGILISTSSGKFSDLHVENASFFKLDNFNLGYTIPLSPEGGVKRLRVYFAGNNTFMITNYKGVDPEVRWEDGGNPLAPGIDRRNTWYLVRSWSLGLQLGL